MFVIYSASTMYDLLSVLCTVYWASFLNVLSVFSTICWASFLQHAVGPRYAIYWASFLKFTERLFHNLLSVHIRKCTELQIMQFTEHATCDLLVAVSEFP
jgi:hypothetical protein